MKLEGLILLEDAGMKCRLLLLRLGKAEEAVVRVASFLVRTEEVFQ